MRPSNDLVSGSHSLSDALTRLAATVSSRNEVLTFFGFFVHLDAMAENDFIFEVSHADGYQNLNLRQEFLDVGGTRDNFYAPDIPKTDDAVFLDLPSFYQILEASNQKQKTFVHLVLNMGFQSVWMIPIHAKWTGGYGTLNYFHQDRHAPPPMPQEEMYTFAEEFFLALRHNGLLAKYFGITDLERRTLQSISKGISTKDVAAGDNVSVGAI